MLRSRFQVLLILLIPVILIVLTALRFHQPFLVDVTPIPDNLSIEAEEGDRMHLNPTSASNMRMAVCEQHFPVGSQGRANVQQVVDLINDAPYLNINITLEERPHIDEDDLYTCGSPFAQDVFVELVDERPPSNTCGQSQLVDFDATGAVFHWVFDPARGQFVWTWGRRVDGLPSIKAVLALRKTANYNTYANNPTTNINNAPSMGVIAHELGHMLHMGHPEDRTSHQNKLLENMTNRRSSADCRGVDHGSDLRVPRITGYTRHIWDNIYPPAGANNDAKYEWVIHDVILQEDTNGDIASHNMRTFEFVNPTDLYYSPLTRKLMDVNTQRPARFRMQFSDASNKAYTAKNGLVKVRIRLRNLDTGVYLTLVDEEITIHQGDKYAQYHFQQQVQTVFDLTTLDRFDGANVELQFLVDASGRFDEFNEDDNQLTMPITVTKRGLVATARRVGTSTLTPILTPYTEDPRDNGVPNGRDFRFSHLDYEDGKIYGDISFYGPVDPDRFQVYFDSDKDGAADYVLNAWPDSFQVMQETTSGWYNTRRGGGTPNLNARRYQFCFNRNWLDLSVGESTDYWTNYYQTDRMPDEGAKTIEIN